MFDHKYVSSVRAAWAQWRLRRAGLMRDAGMNTLEMLILATVLVVAGGAFAVAMNGKVQEKISEFLGA